MALSKAQGSSTGETDLHNVRDAITRLPLEMAQFSSSLLSLDNRFQLPASQDESVQKFNFLREDTRKNGLVYCKVVLPVVTNVVTAISDYFDTYQVLTYEEWLECLDEIKHNVSAYQDMCTSLIDMHEEILVSLKRSNEEADTAIFGLEELKKKYEENASEKRQKVKELKERASTQEATGNVLAFFTFGISKVIGDSRASANRVEAEEEAIRATALVKNVEIASSAIYLVKEVMIPGISAFINGLQTCAGFFSVTHENLRKMQMNIDNAQGNASAKMYFVKMKAVAGSISNDCGVFAMMLPSVRTNFMALKERGESDQNYVDCWEAEQIEKIKKRIGSGSRWLAIAKALGKAPRPENE